MILVIEAGRQPLVSPVPRDVEHEIMRGRCPMALFSEYSIVVGCPGVDPGESSKRVGKKTRIGSGSFAKTWSAVRIAVASPIETNVPEPRMC